MSDMLCENLSKEDNEIVTNYFICKGILSLLYADDFNLRFEIANDALYIDYTNFLVMLNDIVNQYYILLDNNAINNLDNIIKYFREEYVLEHPDEKLAVYGTINNIIKMRNNANMNGLGLFVPLEWYLRFYNEKEISTITAPQNIYGSFAQLKALMVQDFDILYTHFSCTDSEFIQVKEDYSNINCLYLPNINKIISECPTILKDKEFMSRVNSIIELKDEKLGNAKRGDCKLPRKVLRRNFKRSKEIYYGSLTIE